jgi:ubiquitin C-terminal hydrolase
MSSDTPKKGQIGLANLGNTCYLNAILQCLRHVTDLTVFFYKHSDKWIHEGTASDAALCRAYKDLIGGMWSGSPPGYLRPAGFLNQFRESLRGTIYEHMRSREQHDGHEALTFLLDQLHEGMTRPLNLNVMADPASPVFGALTAWKEKVAPKYSPMVDYFFGLMEVSVTCSGCGHVSCRYEPFNMLTVDFPNFKAASLSDCLDGTFSEENIDEYQCDKCSPDTPKGSDTPKPKRHPGVIRRRIWKLPQNLILVVKRFVYDARGLTKCHANLTAEPTQRFEKWFKDTSPESSRLAEYTLQSVVDHHGTANGGHYTAQVRSPITNSWNIYDDESVNMIGDGSKPHLGPMTYILFYRKG